MYQINQLPKQDIAGSPTGCCPKFDPEAWNGHMFRFRDKLFMKVSTRSFLHVPLNMGSVMKHAMQEIDAAGARSGDEYIILSYDVSPWSAEHYISVSREVPYASMARLSGTYIAKVFEGQFQNAHRWYKELNEYAGARSTTPSRVYFYYTTCPRCAKFYGKNYVVGFAQIAGAPSLVGERSQDTAAPVAVEWIDRI